jgi:hypothetical protein
MATASRSDEGGGVVGFAIVFLTVVLSAVGFATPFPLYVLLLVVGTVLAVRAAGLSGFGLAALVLVALAVAMSLVPRVLAGQQSPDLEEPVPVPSGYGFVLGSDSTNVTHVYASKTLVGHERAAKKAQVEVLDYYVKRLQDLGWTVVSLGGGAEFKAPDSEVGIGVHVYLGIPPWAAGEGTVVLQLSARRCPDENHCEPPLIYDIKPYDG